MIYVLIPVLLIVLWIAWCYWRTKVVMASQFYFDQFLEAAEDDNLEAGMLAIRVFNEKTANALNHHPLAKLVQLRYIRADQAARFVQLNQKMEADPLTKEIDQLMGIGRGPV